MIPEWHDALILPFAHHLEPLLFDMDILTRQGYQFSAA